MAKINKKMVDFFIQHLGVDFKDKYVKKQEEWTSLKMLDHFFKELLKKGSPILKKKAGHDFSVILLEDVKAKFEFTSIQNAVSFIPKIFTQYISGHGSGIWKSEQVSEGYIKLKENTPLDCFFTEGMLTGFLSGAGAMGAIVRHHTCRKDDENNKFCVYELIWMKSNFK